MAERIVIDQSKLTDKQQDTNADWIKKRNLKKGKKK